MTHDDRGGLPKPTPERLIAYVDGELDAAGQEQVRAWLEGHPEAAAEVEGQRRLERAWQAAAPPEPSPAQWALTLERIERGIAGRPNNASARRVRRGIGSWWWAVAGTAAAAAAAAVLVPALPHQAPLEKPIPARMASFPVAAPDDVEIISMHAADYSSLVVGRPPLRGRLVLAVADDVSFDEFGDDVEVILGGEGQTSSMAPMVLVPLEVGARKGP